MNKFGERLKIAIELRGLTQTKVSLNCKIDKGNLSHYIKGDFMPKQDIIIRLANYLDVNVLWLLGIVDNMSVQSREISTIAINKAVGLEPTKDELLKQTLIDDITAIASRQDLDTLRTIYNIVKSISK
jgi:transcriptional regulator with XRE-family HTH domain